MPKTEDVCQRLQGQVCLIYSSQTGNTRRVAEALKSATNFPLFAVGDDLDIASYPILALGFWVKRGRPDELMLNFLQGISGKQIFFFCTHAAWPDSLHIQKCRELVTTLLTSNANRVLGSFNCQGKVRASQDGRISTHHPLTAERLQRLQEAKRHPNEADFMQAIHSFTLALSKVELKL